MTQRIVILGGGTGGTLLANRLARRFGEEAQITVIDRDDTHIYQPGLLFVPFGLAEPEEIVRPRHAQLRGGIDFRLAEVENVDLAENTVHLVDGPDIPYDVLVIATGATLQPQETEGLRDPSGAARSTPSTRSRAQPPYGALWMASTGAVSWST